MTGIETVYIYGFGQVPSSIASVSTSGGISGIEIPRPYLVEGIYNNSDEKVEQKRYTSFSESMAITMARTDGLVKLIKCEKIIE